VLSYCTLALIFTVNPISSPRYVAGTVLLSLTVMAITPFTRLRFRLVVTGLLLAMLFVFPYADRFRGVGEADGLLTKGNTVQALQNGDYDSFFQITNSTLLVQEYGVTNGRQALGVALFWVPRSVWPGKPDDTGVLIAESRGYEFTNLSAPIWAELNVNGGWPMVLLGMVLCGAAIRKADRGVPVESILGPIAPFYLLIILRGSLLQAVAFLLVLVGIASAMTHRRGRSEVPLSTIAPESQRLDDASKVPSRMRK
jgi:hypothetical protein